MKSHFLWAACIVAALFQSNSLFAQSIELYGLGHVSLDHVDDGQTSDIYTASNSSRLGVKGSFDISSDLQVFFQYESGVDLTAQGVNDGNGPADTQGQFFTKGRPTHLGLRGRFGQVLIGHTNALDQWANHFNPFADYIGDLGNLWGGTGMPGRVDNAIQYTTPNYKGFNLVTTYVPEENGAGTDRLFMKGNYRMGNFEAGMVYATIAQGPGRLDHHSQAVIFGYDFGRVKLGSAVQFESDVMGMPGVSRNSYSFGGSMPMGRKGTLKAQFTTTEGDFVESDAVQFAVGYDYALNSSTTVYAAAASIQNDDNVQFAVNGKGHGDAVTPNFGDDPFAFSLGLIYSFNIGVGDSLLSVGD